MKDIKIKVNGMVCEGCENRLKKALLTIEGIDNVEASHKTGLVTIKLNKEIETSTIYEKIDDLGFEAIKE